MASNPEISADFLTFIYAENGTFLALNGSELERLKQTLILVKEKYKELKESAIENNASNAVLEFPYTFPTLRIGWYSEKYSKFVSSEPINLTPSFLIHDGEYIMFIMKDVISENNETEKFIWKLCSETDFDRLIYYLDADLIKQSFKK